MLKMLMRAISSLTGHDEDLKSEDGALMVKVAGSSGSSGAVPVSIMHKGPDTLAQPIVFAALGAWQRYEFPAGSNITYLTFDNKGAEWAVVYLDAESTAARDAICNTNGAPPAGMPIPGLYYIAPGETKDIPLRQALTGGQYGGGVVDVRSHNTATAIEVLMTAG